MDLQAQADRLFSAVVQDLKGRHPTDAMGRLCAGLEQLRAGAGELAWRRFSRELFPAMDHPLKRLVYRDPMTRRACDKPRGYAGDPGVLDYLYLRSAPDAEADPIAAMVCACVCSSGGGRSIRHRKATVADNLSSLSDPRLRVLCVGCGYLRELDDLEREDGFVFDAFHALDADPLSIEYIAARYPSLSLGVCTVEQILAGWRLPAGIDFAYTVGETDTLAQEPARRLAAALFDTLRPGGTLFMANVATGFSERGYLETFMQWFPQYRDPAAMADLTTLIPPERIAGHSVGRDPAGNMLYLQVFAAL